MKKQITLLLCSLVLAGCADQAAPNLIGGHYYMAGDAQCKRARVDVLSNNDRVLCYDADMKYTGYRSAMDANDMAVYQTQQQAQAQQIQALNTQLAITNAQMAAQNAQNMQIINSTRYSAPAAAPVPQQDNTVIRCVNTGNYTNCRY
ncbi:hypothetical protein AB4Y36_03520 [Paraburkholderia sp. BR10936]|uniref:hypothetical protein n=1 Tax=Paraburkholderia sp. BR10936 TaxID=3236993 RepID=UPI0034D34C01